MQHHRHDCQRCRLRARPRAGAAGVRRCRPRQGRLPAAAAPPGRSPPYHAHAHRGCAAGRGGVSMRVCPGPASAPCADGGAAGRPAPPSLAALARHMCHSSASRPFPRSVPHPWQRPNARSSPQIAMLRQNSSEAPTAFTPQWMLKDKDKAAGVSLRWREDAGAPRRGRIRPPRPPLTVLAAPRRTSPRPLSRPSPAARRSHGWPTAGATRSPARASGEGRRASRPSRSRA